MTAPQKSVLTLKRSARPENEPQLEERLHKVLANAGLGSRRMLEQRIQAGEIELNGTPAALGASVHAGENVTAVAVSELDKPVVEVVQSSPRLWLSWVGGQDDLGRWTRGVIFPQSSDKVLPAGAKRGANSASV